MKRLLSYFQKKSSAEVFYLTGIGHDHFSHDLYLFLEKEGLNCSGITYIDDKKLGLYVVHNDRHGERTFSYWRKNSAAKYFFSNVDIAALQHNLLKECTTFYFSGISLAILPEWGRFTLLDTIKILHHAGIPIVFDSNYRAALWHNVTEAQYWMNAVQPYLHTALLTMEDEAALYDEKCSTKHILKRYASVEELIIKRGKAPCWLRVSNHPIQTIVSVKIPDAAVVDTTGAGDAFNGAYIAARIQGYGPEQSVRIAHQLAGYVIQYHGAIIDRKLMDNRLKQESKQHACFS